MKKVLKLLSVFVLACALLLGAGVKTKAESKNWSVYYAKGGGNGENKDVLMPSYGGKYRAACSQLQGNCASRVVKISGYDSSANKTKVTFNKTVEFSVSGRNIDFSLTKMPKTKNMYFHIYLDHSNGTSASAAGSIKTL